MTECYDYKQQCEKLIDRLEIAKSIIEDLKELYFSPVVTKNDLKRQDEILERANKFLSSQPKE